MRATARSCVFSSVFAWRLSARRLHPALRSSASGWPAGDGERKLTNWVRFQSNKWLVSVHDNPVSGSKTDVILNLKITLSDNGKRRYFKLKKTLQFSEMTLQ